MQPNRRQVLGGGALLAAAWIAAQAIGHRPIATAPSPFLGPSEAVTLAAVLEVLLPPHADHQQFATEIDKVLATGDPLLNAGLIVALRALEHTGGASPFQFRRFSRRSAAERADILEHWRLSRLGTKRQIYSGLRSVAMFAYYASEDSWAAIGYDGPLVGR